MKQCDFFFPSLMATSHINYKIDPRTGNQIRKPSELTVKYAH